MPIDDAQKEVLRKRLELARASKVAKKQKINDVVQAPKAEVDEPKQVQEEKEEVVSVAPTIPMAKEPLVELPKKAKSEGRKDDKKDRYAKLVFYKDPSQKTIKKMTSILASSDDDEPAEKAPTKQVNIAPPTPQIKPQPQIDPKLLRQQQISNLSKRFFDC